MLLGRFSPEPLPSLPSPHHTFSCATAVYEGIFPSFQQSPTGTGFPRVTSRHQAKRLAKKAPPFLSLSIASCCPNRGDAKSHSDRVVVEIVRRATKYAASGMFTSNDFCLRNKLGLEMRRKRVLVVGKCTTEQTGTEYLNI